MNPRDQIGKYELLERIGEGGMAEVWKAQSKNINRLVAIKFLLDRFANNAELEQRFLTEAKVQARLRHPNIVSAIDMDQQNGRSYLVMDYVEGPSLETLLQKRGHMPLEMGQVFSISLDILSALDYAHTLREGDTVACIIHRDVKPSNILLEPSGFARLADFGIAVVLNEKRFTTFGVAPGSVYYMSPEQIDRPRDIDWRTDIYSFGCVLYEMLTGRPPFGTEAETDFAIRRAQVEHMPVPLQRWNPKVPFDLEVIVLRALNKHPADRYQTCGQMASAIQAVAAKLGYATGRTGQWIAPPPPQAVPSFVPPGPPSGGRGHTYYEPPRSTPPPMPPPPPAASRSKRRAVPIALSVLGLAAVAVAIYLWLNPGPQPDDIILRFRGSTSVGDDLAPELAKKFLEVDRHGVLEKEYTKEVVENGKDGKPVKRVYRYFPARVAGMARRQTIEILAEGSGKAFEAMAAGECDLCMSSRPVNNDDLKKNPKLPNTEYLTSSDAEHVIALDGIGVIVNNRNPIASLSMVQLRGIYCSVGAKITRWDQLDGPHEAIHLLGRNADSGTADSFRSIVCGKDPREKDIELVKLPDEDRIKSSVEIVKRVAQDPYAIGYVSYTFAKDQAKLLKISETGSEARLPTAGTVGTQDYPIHRSLFLYTPPGKSEMAQRFLNFTQGPIGQKIVDKVGFLPLVPQIFDCQLPASASVEYRDMVNGAKRLNIDFRFQTGKAFTLDNLSAQQLSRLKTYLKDNRGTQLKLIGFADNAGSGSPEQRKEMNRGLSEKRAKSVAAELQDFVEGGIPPDDVKGFGEESPAADNDTDYGRKQNRRVQVWVVSPVRY